MIPLLSCRDVAKLLPSRRTGRTITPEQVKYYVRTGVKVGDRRIKLNSRESPGGIAFTEDDVQHFLDEITTARQSERAKQTPKPFLKAEGILP